MIESLGISDIQGTPVPLSKVVFVRKKPPNGSRVESGGKRWEENLSREIQEHPSLLQK